MHEATNSKNQKRAINQPMESKRKETIKIKTE